MIKAQEFLDECKNYGFSFFTGTPCSYLKPFINTVIDFDDYTYVDATNEGDAIAIAAGSMLAGKKSVVMFQNSGLGNAVNPLTSLTYTFQIPVMVITTLRGEPGGAKDEPQHELMGEITTSLLETMKIKWEYFPREASEIKGALKRANDYMNEFHLPFCFVMRKGDIEEYALKTKKPFSEVQNTVTMQDDFKNPLEKRMTRTRALSLIQNHLDEKTYIVATTGMTGRELESLNDHDHQIYMVGSMGCALAMGLGLALQKPKAKIIVIDGDGALLMRTGSMATVGHYHPKNLVHILLDNEVHDSTGGQATVTRSISFGGIAKSFGYKNVYSTDTENSFTNFLSTVLKEEQTGPCFFHVKIRPGSPKEIGRPKMAPKDVAARFVKAVAKTAN